MNCIIRNLEIMRVKRGIRSSKNYKEAVVLLSDALEAYPISKNKFAMLISRLNAHLGLCKSHPYWLDVQPKGWEPPQWVGFFEDFLKSRSIFNVCSFSKLQEVLNKRVQSPLSLVSLDDMLIPHYDGCFGSEELLKVKRISISQAKGSYFPLIPVRHSSIWATACSQDGIFYIIYLSVSGTHIVCEPQAYGAALYIIPIEDWDLIFKSRREIRKSALSFNHVEGNLPRVREYLEA